MRTARVPGRRRRTRPRGAGQAPARPAAWGPAAASALAVQHQRVGRTQLVAGVGTQLVREPDTGGGEQLQRLGHPPGRGQRPHQSGHQRLRQRVLRDELAYRADHLEWAAEPQCQHRPRRDGVQPFEDETGTQPLDPLPGRAGERHTAPETRRRVQQPGTLRLGSPAVVPGPDQTAEPVQVHPVRVDVQHVTAGCPGQGHRGTGLLDQAADPGQMRVQRRACPFRRVVTPHPLRQRPQRHRLAGGHQEAGEHGPLLRWPRIERPVADAHRGRAQQLK